MAKDNQIAVRMNDPTYDAVRKYAEEYDLTNAEAMREMSERVLRGEGYLDTPGPIADGGIIRDRLDEIEKAQKDRLDEIKKAQKDSLDEIENIQRKEKQLQNAIRTSIPIGFVILALGVISLIGVLFDLIPFSIAVLLWTPVPMFAIAGMLVLLVRWYYV